MKIAIQGHLTRGHEIIQILESLGGINCNSLRGNSLLKTYYIDEKIIRYDSAPKNYKVYTLEEFEKEFPFKIGDIILLKGINKPYEVIALEWYMNKLCYKLDNGLHYAPETLTTYKEMKEERNIKLTLDKAKEWYKKGGELKEIALQAFSEEELTKVELPKTWEEFCINYPVKKGESWLAGQAQIFTAACDDTNRIYKNWIPSKKSAEAHLALIQLEQLRDCYRGSFTIVKEMPVWCIIRYNGKLVISQRIWGTNETFLSFPSLKAVEEFLKCFRSLIEQAGDLI